MNPQKSPHAQLSNRGRVRAAIGLCAMLLAFSMCWDVATSAQADGVIPIQWNGPTMNVSWDGGSYAIIAGSIVGDVVATPGDRAERTAIVQNGGPTPARATVQILNVTTSNDPDTVNTNLEDLIHLFWNINGNKDDITWREAREAADPNGISYEVSFHLSQGEKFSITAGYYFPASATTGKNEGKPSSALRFDIRILMQGDDHVKIPTGGTGGTAGAPVGGYVAALMVTMGIAIPVSQRILKKKK